MPDKLNELTEKLKKLGGVLKNIDGLLHEAENLRHDLERAISSSIEVPDDVNIEIPIFESGEDCDPGGVLVVILRDKGVRMDLHAGRRVSELGASIGIDPRSSRIQDLATLLFIKDNLDRLVAAIDKKTQDLESGYSKTKKALQELKEVFAPILVASKLSGS